MSHQSSRLPALLSVLVLGAPALHARQAPAPAAERPAVALRSLDAAGAKLVYQSLPWGPQTFATMESASDSFYNKRSWPFARLETSAALKLGATPLPPGNYALVFVPASSEQPGMRLQVLKVAAGEFFQAGNPMTRTPQGESVHTEPVTFERAAETVPALELSLDDAPGGLTLKVAYGDRRLSRRFER
jgi:hypothetical protein